MIRETEEDYFVFHDPTGGRVFILWFMGGLYLHASSTPSLNNEAQYADVALCGVI